MAKNLLRHQRLAKNESTKTQDAHEAVRPTSVMRPPAAMKAVLSRDQLRLYKLIWERFVASQMAPAVLDTVTVDLVNGDVRFRATVRKLNSRVHESVCRRR